MTAGEHDDEIGVVDVYNLERSTRRKQKCPVSFKICPLDVHWHGISASYDKFPLAGGTRLMSGSLRL